MDYYAYESLVAPAQFLAKRWSAHKLSLFALPFVLSKEQIIMISLMWPDGINYTIVAEDSRFKFLSTSSGLLVSSRDKFLYDEPLSVCLKINRSIPILTQATPQTIIKPSAQSGMEIVPPKGFIRPKALH
jgi:hypothetical protein